MKKAIIFVLIIFIILGMNAVFATEINIMDKEITSEILENKEKAAGKYEEKVIQYGNNKTYGMTAYALDIIRWYSIPACFLGIAAGAIAQFALGTRRLDMKQKGARMIFAFITLLVICQVMPLVFAIVVRGWAI